MPPSRPRRGTAANNVNSVILVTSQLMFVIILIKGGILTFRTPHVEDHLYFITGTILNWTPILTIPEYRDVILNSWIWHKTNQRLMIYAFVVMPDHIHWISLPIPPYTINEIIWSFSSYTAHEILKIARSNQHHELLKIFSCPGQPGRNHQIWQNFQAKNIYSYRFLIQKMEYIHDNPIRRFPLIYRNRHSFPYSSAIYYDLGIDPIIEIDDIYAFMDNLA